MGVTSPRTPAHFPESLKSFPEVGGKRGESA